MAELRNLAGRLPAPTKVIEVAGVMTNAVADAVQQCQLLLAMGLSPEHGCRTICSSTSCCQCSVPPTYRYCWCPKPRRPGLPWPRPTSCQTTWATKSRQRHPG